MILHWKQRPLKELGGHTGESISETDGLCPTDFLLCRGKIALRLGKSWEKGRKKKDIRCYPMSSPLLRHSVLPSADILICQNLIDVAFTPLKYWSYMSPTGYCYPKSVTVKKLLPVLYHSWSSQILSCLSNFIILFNITDTTAVSSGPNKNLI